MNDIEALAQVKYIKDLDDFLRKINKEETVEYWDLCVRALEKQIPRKVQEIDKDEGYFICRMCNHLICYSDDYESHIYCLNCGQKLDWTSL